MFNDIEQGEIRRQSVQVFKFSLICTIGLKDRHPSYAGLNSNQYLKIKPSNIIQVNQSLPEEANQVESFHMFSIRELVDKYAAKSM